MFSKSYAAIAYKLYFFESYAKWAAFWVCAAFSGSITQLIYMSSYQIGNLIILNIHFIIDKKDAWNNGGRSILGNFSVRANNKLIWRKL